MLSEVRAGRTTYRRVPRRYLALRDFRITDEQWDSLAIPVNMAFLTTGSDGSAYYTADHYKTFDLVDRSC